MLRIETKVDLKSYLLLVFALTYRKPIIIITLILMAIMAFIMRSYGMPLVFLLIMNVFFYFYFRRNYSSNNKVKERIIYEFSDERIKLIGETFSSEMAWSGIYKVVELKKWFLLYHNNENFNMVSKDASKDQIEELRSIIKRTNIKAKLRND